MRELNLYLKNLKGMINVYSKELPESIYSIDKESKGKWSDPIWYIQDPDTREKHRYIFTKSRKGIKRTSKDTHFNKNKDFKLQLLSEFHDKLLKLYTIHIQNLSISSNSKQHRAVIAAQVLTEAEKYKSINEIPSKFWNSHNMSNMFWDFCKEHRLLSSSQRRPIHVDRLRSADDSIERANRHLKMTKMSTIYAVGDIFNKVFKDVSKNGKLRQKGYINVIDAIPVTVALLGLASPDRLNSEVPLLKNQKLKTLKPKIGDPIHYLDWPGSKGFQDNQNHILSVLAPQVKKAINFFHYHFQPERLYVRYLKNPNLSWEELLADFRINLDRKKLLNFDHEPNLFTVAYALGFFPIEHKVYVLKDRNDIVKTSSQRGWKWNLGWCKELKRVKRQQDCLIEKNISHVSDYDLILNLKGGKNNRNYNFYHSIQRFCNTSQITEGFRNRLNLSLVVDLKTLEQAIIKLQLENIPSFPISYAGTDKGIDLEDALFCVSLSKHDFAYTQGMSGSPLCIVSISKIKTLFTNPFLISKNPNSNIFFRYGFGEQKLLLHSLRHFVNTQAEKGGIPLAVIAAWSGRTSIKQTLEYVHTSEEEQSERLISTLDFNENEHDIRVITNDELQSMGGLPASTTSTGICIQELSVTPCDYINDFLTPCFGCDESCYICGDAKAIEMLEYDLKLQQVRLDSIQTSQKSFLSKAKKDWWIKHSQGVILLEQLISIMREQKNGDLIRISSNKSEIFITDIKTKAIKQINIALPSPEELLKKIKSEEPHTSKIPESMKSLIAHFDVKN
ncbi:hypothetical protein [Pseudocolwellia agarivorans]|uniref:hypothetical protein n=1 Tax=Pseudocolwellia agarivorans TaxID=1911682 RepID=UPI003F8831B2